MNETATASPLDAIIAEYIQAVEAGAVPSREDLLAKHHNLAADLQAFFADYDRMDNRADAFKLTTKPAAVRPTVKYIGDYELLEEIAEGGMGLVYKARQVSLSRVVALKLVRAGHLAKPLDVARFRIEAEAAAGLDHPNIVPIHEVGEHEGQQYLVMKFIDGPTLANLPRGDIRTEVTRLQQVVQAVDSAHRQGILHRDIKPSNILTDSTGTPFVTDFGLAKRMDADLSLTETGQSVGTAGYWSPEQALGKKGLNVTTDVFSLGAVLYERLTGKMAFPGTTHLERLRSLDNDPSRPTYLLPTLPRDLETVCLKCLEREPGKRYPGADELADDLARWLRGEPITARRTTNMERFWLWCRRNPAVAGWAGATVFTIIVGGLIASYFAVLATREAALANSSKRLAETALARGYMRTIGFNREKLTDAEHECLEELSTCGNEQLIKDFLNESLRNPTTAIRLSRRSDWVAQAIVGINEHRKTLALDLAKKVQHDVTLASACRHAACCLAIQLGSVDFTGANWHDKHTDRPGAFFRRGKDLSARQLEQMVPHLAKVLEASTDAQLLDGAREAYKLYFEIFPQAQRPTLPMRAKMMFSVNVSDPDGALSRYVSRHSDQDKARRTPVANSELDKACVALESTNSPNILFEQGRKLATLSIHIERSAGEARILRVLSALIRLLEHEGPGFEFTSELPKAIIRVMPLLNDKDSRTIRIKAAEAVSKSICRRAPHVDSLQTNWLRTRQWMNFLDLCDGNSKSETDELVLETLLSLDRWDQMALFEDGTIGPFILGGIHQPKSIAALLANRKCVGRVRDACIRRLEELAFPPSATEQQQAVAASVVSGLAEPLAAGVLAAGRQAKWERERKFRTIWDAVAWLKVHHPEIDLDAPYKPRK